MNDPMPKIHALFRAQSVLTRIELRAKTIQAVYMCVALVFGLLAFGMLNLAAYLALSDVVGPIWSGVIMAVGDLLLAVILVKTAEGVKPGPELDIAREVRDIALEGITNDAEHIKSQIVAARDDFKSVTSGLSKVGGMVPGVSSVVNLLTRALKKKKK